MDEKELENLRTALSYIVPGRTNMRICAANRVASNDTADFSKLTEFAKSHPYMFRDIMRAYKKSPDDRFGDTLLIFCSQVKSGAIKIDKGAK